MLCTLMGMFVHQRNQGVDSPPPPPNNAFLEFCRYIWKFVGTSKPTSLSFVPTEYLKPSTNKILKETAVLECENAKIF